MTFLAEFIITQLEQPFFRRRMNPVTVVATALAEWLMNDLAGKILGAVAGEAQFR